MNCTMCGAPAAYVNNSVLYGRSFGEWPYLWHCQNAECGASVGVHPGTDKPLGTFADKATRQARIAAHAAFDPLWKDGSMKRKDAYAWLAERMGIDVNDCHIGMFDKAQCEQVFWLVMASEVSL